MEKPKAYISKVVVEGFKSYGRKRKEIPLGEGFIAIVGPNGSGKSNIGDAISFALGLASSKVLRAKNLSYLIWSKGNQKADYAEVEVHFKNEGAFPIEAEEIVFSRKVFPNGRSVFKINGKPVKERDVKELLTRAGITENAYNVVLQGDIIHFLKMTPVQRRKLIEEIAGIGEFDEKKQKALEELGEVEIKLKELKLILEELESQLKTLERDRETLLRYRELKAKEEELRKKILAKEHSRLRRRMENLEGEREEKENLLRALEGEREKLLEELQKEENRLSEVEKLLEPYREKIGKFQSEEEFLSREIERLRGEIEKLQNLKGELKQRIENLKGEIEAKENRKAEIEKEIERLKVEMEPLQNLLEEYDKELEALEGKLSEAVKGLEEAERRLKELQKEKEEKEKLIRGLLKELNTLDVKIERTEEQLKELEKKKRELLAGFVGNFSYEKEKLEKLLEEKEREKQQLEELLRKIDNRLREIKRKKEELLREQIRLEAELQSAGNEVVEFLKRNVEGVYGTVAELIRVRDEEYITAVEIAGGNRLRYVVVEDENTAKRCIELLKRNNLGRLTFIPLNRIRAQTPQFLPRTRGVIDFVYKLVDYDPHFEKAILYVFGDTVLVEDFETAKRLGIGIYRMVTLSGELFEKGGTITGGTAKSSNLLREGYIRGRLEEVKEELASLERKEEKLRKEYEKTKEKLWSVEGAINYTRRKLKELENLHSSGVRELKEVEERIKRGEEYLQYLKGEREKKEKLLEELEERVVQLEEEIEELTQKREEYLAVISQSGMEEIKQKRKEVLQKLETLKGELQKFEREHLAVEKDIENLRRELSETEVRLSEVEKKIEELQKEIGEKEKRLREVKEKYLKVGETVSHLVRERDEIRERIEGLKRELALLEAKAEKVRSERDKILVELAKVEQNIENLLKEAGGEIPPEPQEDLNTLKRELSEVEKTLKGLGNVNFRAEEEYQEIKNRYGEYREKYQTLLREKRAITDFIREIETKKERIFMETFRAINRHFKEIFAFLSPGGKAYMELEKPHDIFSGGINMVVKPRGKEVKYLEAMSGGEKTLAALSLIFAIQRYKPAPFYYFDEVDAHLDEANAVKVGELIKEYSKEAQFIVVTLRESVAYLADRLIGVTSKGGVSEVYFLDPARLGG